MEAERLKKLGYPEPPKVVAVTPDIATKWLEGNTHNRGIDQKTVEKYARDMKRKLWVITHQGIAFDTVGTLVDGQHRLWAVIESGETVPMLVHHGLPIETQVVIDTHHARNLRDRLILTDNFGDVTHAEVGVLRRLLKGIGNWHSLTPQEEQEAFKKHEKAIRFAVSAFPGRRTGITTSPVYAVIARAFYSQDAEALKRFCYVVFSGQFSAAKEKVAVLLRDALISRDSNGRSIKTDVAYLKTSNALRAFLDGKTLERLYPASEEQFALPGEKARVKRFTAKTPKRYDQIDKVMAFMRENTHATAQDVARAIKRNATQAKAILDECARLGWLHVTPGTKSKQNPTRYSLVLKG